MRLLREVLRRRPELWLGAVAAVPYVAMLVRGRMVFLLDILAEHYPAQAMMTSCLARTPGDLPVWNPYLFCGCPLMADPQMQTCYPPALLFRFWPYAAALGGYLAMHAVLAVGGAYAFLRIQRIGMAGAALGAAAFGLGGQMFVSAATPVCLATMAWIPWAGWGAVLVMRRPGAGPALGLAMILAWMALAGYPQFVMYAAALIVFLWIAEGCPRRGAAWIGVASLLAVAVDAIQVLPSMAYLPSTGRGTPLGETAGVVDALQWTHLRGYLLPVALAALPDGSAPEIRSLWPTFNYVGTLPLLLAGAGVWTALRNRNVPAPLVLAGGATMLALGKHVPAIGGWLATLSLAAWFRRSAYWMCVANLAVAWLAGTSLDRFARPGGPAGRRRWAAVFVAMTWAELLAVGVSIQPSIPAAWIMAPAPVESWLSGRLGPGRSWGRVYTAGSRLREGIQEGRDLRDSAARVRAALRPNLPAAAGLRQIDGVGPLFPARVLAERLVLEGPDRAAASALLDRLGATDMLFLESSATAEGAGEAPEAYVFRRPRAWPPIRAIGRGSEEVQITVATPGHWEFVVDMARSGTVVIAESWMPGWRARDTGGGEIPTRADSDGLIAFTLGRGHHQVVASYDQPGAHAGLWLSLCALAGALAWAARFRRSGAPAARAQSPRRAQRAD